MLAGDRCSSPPPAGATRARRRSRCSRETRAARPASAPPASRRGRRRADRPRGRAGGRRSSAASGAAVEPARPTAPGRRASPPDPETLGVTRRQFLNRGIVTLMSARPRRASARPCSPSCGRSSAGGFGSKIKRRQARRHQRARSTRARRLLLRRPRAASWITAVPGGRARRRPRRSSLPAPCSPAWRPASSRSTRSACTSAAACRSASTSQWFECPCHGSQYNRVGEKKGGPAPRGLDRFAVAVDGGIVIVDTGSIILGPPIGTNTTGQEAEGPHCITRRRECTECCSRQAVHAEHRHRHRGRPHAGAGSSYVIGNLRAGQGRGRLRDRARAEPQAVPRRRGARGPQARRGAQLVGLGSLVVIAVGLPLYWLHEPGRQAGRRRGLRRAASPSGARRLFATTAEGGFNCAGCHGGMKASGGVARVHRHRPADGERRRRCSWKAPALNTVLLPLQPRTRSRYILTYGRPFSPMPAWGVAGGGPLNDQQIRHLIAYLESIQLTPEAGRRPQVPTTALRRRREGTTPVRRSARARARRCSTCRRRGGAYSCARCHTKGWSVRRARRCRAAAPSGPNLTNGDTVRQFPSRSRPDRRSSTDRLRGRQALRRAGSGHGPHAGLRPDCCTPRTDPGHRRLRAEPLMHVTASSLTLAFTWDPEIRGILVVLIARRRAVRSASTCCSPPTSAPGSGCPGRARRALRLDDDHGRRSGGSTASA